MQILAKAVRKKGSLRRDKKIASIVLLAPPAVKPAIQRRIAVFAILMEATSNSIQLLRIHWFFAPKCVQKANTRTQIGLNRPMELVFPAQSIPAGNARQLETALCAPQETTF